SCQELGGASSAPTPCSPCASPVSTATGTPIGASAAKTARPQIKTAPPYHKNPQHDCITLDRTLRVRTLHSFCANDAKCALYRASLTPSDPILQRRKSAMTGGRPWRPPHARILP